MIEVRVVIEFELAIVVFHGELHRCGHVGRVSGNPRSKLQHRGLSDKSCLLNTKLKLRRALVIEHFHAGLAIEQSLSVELGLLFAAIATIRYI